MTFGLAQMTFDKTGDPASTRSVRVSRTRALSLSAIAGVADFLSWVFFSYYM